MTTQTDISTARAARAARRESRARALRPLGVAAATLAGLAVWVLAGPVLGVELTASAGTGGSAGTGELVVGPVSVAAAGLVAGLAGWGLLTVLERTVTRPRTVWTVVAVAVLVLSLAGPLVQAATPAAALSLVAMHVAVGATVIVLVGGSAREERRASR